MDLVAGADKDEGGDQDVHDGVVWYQDQHPVGVGAQPNMVLKVREIKR